MFLFSFSKTFPFKSLIFIVLIFCFNLSFGHGTTVAAHTDGSDEINIAKITDFKSCALTSLKRTPQLQRSRMEIDLQQLNEDDSRWSFSPTLSLSGSYYFSEDDGSITFKVSSYKPWESYFSLKAEKLITQVVILNHIQATSQALQKIAESLLQILAFDQIDHQYKQILDLHKKRLNYSKQRLKNAVTTPFELEVEQKTRNLIIAERKTSSVKRNTLLQSLRLSMNLPKSYVIELDPEQTLEQILGSLEPKNDANSPRPEPSFNQKIFAIKLKLQEQKIVLAYSKYLPSISMGIRSPDIINVSANDEEDYFFYTGFDLTLWDGNKRGRDITRQKMTLRQMGFEKLEIETNDSLEWLQATQEFLLAKTEYTLSLAAEKIELQQIRKKEFEYDRGDIKLPDLLDAKASFHRDRIRTIGKLLALNKTRLRLRYLSGQLLKENINISITDNAYD